MYGIRDTSRNLTPVDVTTSPMLSMIRNIKMHINMWDILIVFYTKWLGFSCCYNPLATLGALFNPIMALHFYTISIFDTREVHAIEV